MRFNEYSGEASLRRRREQRSSARRRRTAGLLALALVGALAVGGTFAWLTSTSETVINTFTPAEVTTNIDETFNGNLKKNVFIENKNNVPVYVRAQVIVNWVDSAGSIVASVPDGYKYTMTPDLEKQGVPSDWLKGSDGFWYYSKALKAADDASVQLVEKKTSNLLDSVEVSYPKGVAAEAAAYHLSVEILSEAIQALPDDAFNDAWSESTNLKASNGTISYKTA